MEKNHGYGANTHAREKNVNHSEAAQVFDGAMLGDAGLAPYPIHKASLYLSQTGREHLDWLELVKEALICLGSDTETGVRGRQTTGGRQYEESWLYAKTSPFLSAQYKRWHPERRKVVPKDLVLAPISLANWFVGDGSSSWRKNDPEYVSVDYATHCFTPEDHAILIKLLALLDIKASVSGKHLATTDGISVNKLMGLIQPYVVESFQYKIKRSKPSCTSEYWHKRWREGRPKVGVRGVI